MIKLLLIEDDPDHRELIEAQLSLAPEGAFAVQCCMRLGEGIAYLSDHQADLVLLDLSLPDSAVNETLPRFHDHYPHLPVIVLTSLDDRETIMGMIRNGASDCVPKTMLRGGLLERSIRFTLDRLAITRDSLEKQLELETVKSFKLLFDNSPIGFLVKTVEGRVLEANEAFCKLTGYARGELIGSDSSHLTQPRYREETRDAISRISEGQVEELRFEKQYLRKDGKAVWASVFMQPIDWGGERASILVSVYDLSERKEAEARVLDALGQAEEANRAKTGLLAMLGHDIRSPVTSMMSVAYMLEEAALSEEEKQCVENLSEVGHNLLHLIDDILEFSRIDSGKITITPESIHVPDLLESLIREFHELAKRRGIQLQTQCDLRRDIQELDTHRVSQILRNLLSNAVKFSPEGGNVTLGVNEDEGFLIFTVVDEGIGISPEEQAHLFKPFSQANASIRRKYGGTGLGLSLCSQITALMEGQIFLESEPGKGSTFRVVLPKPAANHVTSSTPVNAQGSRRIEGH